MSVLARRPSGHGIEPFRVCPSVADRPCRQMTSSCARCSPGRLDRRASRALPAVTRRDEAEAARSCAGKRPSVARSARAKSRSGSPEARAPGAAAIALPVPWMRLLPFSFVGSSVQLALFDGRHGPAPGPRGGWFPPSAYLFNGQTTSGATTASLPEALNGRPIGEKLLGGPCPIRKPAALRDESMPPCRGAITSQADV